MEKVTSRVEMRKRRGLASGFLGLTVGLILGLLIIGYRALTSNQTQQTASFVWNSSAKQDPPEPMVANLEKLGDDEHINSSSRNLVFVGVMTAEKYLSSRAKAVYETWGKELPGKIAFFSSESSRVPDNCPDLPLVALPRVDDSYPPQKKSFMMLQHMWNNYGDRFEWFIRADDDVYIRADRLEKLLRSVDSRKAHYIGQAGRGNSQEFGLLSLEYDENFCMGGPGIIISRETLKRVVPFIKHCLKNLYTTHEDVELGRCVQKYAGIPCTWNYEMQSILYHNSSGDQAFSGNLKQKEVHRAITLHPIKNPPYMYRLHNYIKALRIQELQQEKINLHRDVYAMAKQLGISTENLIDYEIAEDVKLFPVDRNSEFYPGDTDVLGVPASLQMFKPNSVDEVIPWIFLTKSVHSLTDSNPRRRIHSNLKEGIEDITREVMASINACSRQRGRVVEERSVLYGYRRVNSYGADTILDLLLVYRKYRGRKITLPVRRHVYLHQQFTGWEIREAMDNEETVKNEETEENPLRKILLGNFFKFNVEPERKINQTRRKMIHMILPLSGRYGTFQRFLRNFEDVCLMNDNRTKLTIILFPDKTENSFYSTVNLVAELNSKYEDPYVQVVKMNEEFSRAKALDIGASRLNDNDLMFFIDVDIVFEREALERVRLNTIKGQRVYFPVVFSQYDPNVVYKNSRRPDHFFIDEESGYWRGFGFGIVSIYKQDYVAIGGLDLSIKGWGNEDVDFFERTVKSKIDVFRAADKDLVHIFHGVECAKNLTDSQFAMCLGTKSDTYASTATLAKIILDNPEYLRFAKARRKNLTNVGA